MRRTVTAPIVTIAVALSVAASLGRVATTAKAATTRSPRLTLLSQTTTQGDPVTFSLDVATDPAYPDDGQNVEATLHTSVQSREQFDRATHGIGLGPALAATSSTSSTSSTSVDARTRNVSFSIGSISPTCPKCIALADDGVYPVSVGARAANVAFTTFFVWHPHPVANPVSVALIVPIHLETQTPGAPPAKTDSVIATIEALASSSTPLSIVPTPETLDALSNQTENGPLIDLLRTTLGGREVIGSTYVRWNAALLADPRLSAAVIRQRDLGKSVVDERLGVTSGDDIAVVGDEIPSDVALDGLGIRRIVATESAVMSGDGPIDSTRPLIVDPGAKSGRETQARPTVLVDRRLAGRLSTIGATRTEDNELLRSHHVLAELAVIAMESEPDVARGVALPIPESTTQSTLLTLLHGLDSSPGLFRPTTLGALFAVPLQSDPDGTTTYRIPADGPTQTPAATRSKNTAVQALLTSAKQLAGYRSLFPAVTSTDKPVEVPNRSRDLAAFERRQAALAAEDLTDTERAALMASFTHDLGQRLDKVTLPAVKRITLTGRHQDVRVAVVNDTGQPVDLTMIVESDNVELASARRDPLIPARESFRRPVHIDSRVQEERVSVTTRGPGTFSMVIRLQSPDGYEFSSVRYTLRSTAIGPVGRVLTLGSLAVLALWWGRTILRTRRRKAVLRHPAALPTNNEAA